jgi:hypothetical protein
LTDARQGREFVIISYNLPDKVLNCAAGLGPSTKEDARVSRQKPDKRK